MGIYIGYVEKKGYEPQVFFNYKPIAEVTGTQIRTLSSEEQEELLPESEKRNINFSFSWNDRDIRREVDSLLSDGSLVVFEFTLDDLLPNIKTSGERNQTGYKVQAIDMINAGKIRRINVDGVYYVIHRSELLSDFNNDAIVEIDTPYVLSGDYVFVDLDGFWAGPYEIGYRDYTSSYYIRPQIKENKYTISGYKRDSLAVLELSSYDGYWGGPDYRWPVLITKKDAKSEQKDVITDPVLLEGFRDSLNSSLTNNGSVKLDDIPSLLQRYKDSVLSGDVLTDEVRKNRLNRLVALLTSEEDVDDTLSTISDFICDLLIKYQSSPNVEKWLQILLEKHPGLIEQLKGTQAISQRIAQMEQSLSDLQQKRVELESEIEKKKAEADEVDRAAIEAKKTELLKMDTEYTALCEKLDGTKKALGIVGSLVELQSKQSEFQTEVDYLESHKSHLERESSSLELQFQQLISRPHEKMVGIAFDGFMASKMLQAAAQWEAEEIALQHKSLVNKVNGVPAVDMPPDELINYLCRTIHVVRPAYSRNTIVNIAICLTQNFLTVFSGEPGCGKTSICNIFGEVLGLNLFPQFVDCSPDSADSLKRYIPVSVERGWTSKRDFVGYYNPLSKTFDKSNRRVYDALHMLDTEKCNGTSRFPYVILLDEANLSPMEYYWSDFMNICDDLGPQSKVNLGEDHVFGIPDTLHFFATINNDHTTETLSPRLIDRAWIITLPNQSNASVSDGVIPPEQIRIITWDSLRNAFFPNNGNCILSDEIQRIYDAVLSKLREKRFSISPRVDKAIKRYWVAASAHFEMDETKTEAPIVALDYAIAQRILPKISGNGESFERWLDELRSLCSSHGLNMTAKLLKDIIDRGNQQMKYYQFFC